VSGVPTLALEAPADGLAGQAPTVVLNQQGPEAGQLIAGLDDRVRVLDGAASAPWTLAGEADVLLTGPRNGWRDAPRNAPPGWPGRLRWVHTASAGIDFYPSWLLEVPQVTCSRGVAAVPIAEFVLHALLEQVKQLAGRRVASPGAWRDEFARADGSPLGSLSGQQLGLLGYGAIGREVARRARAFGMRVMALRRGNAPIEDAGVQTARSLHELLASSDHLVLALPATDATHKIINAEALAHARPGLHLVNIARGSLVDHGALLAALDAGRLSAATLDVVDPEPPPPGHALYTHPRVRLTPHISWSAGDVGAATTHKFLDNLARHLAGQPLLDVVDPARGY